MIMTAQSNLGLDVWTLFFLCMWDDIRVDGLRLGRLAISPGRL